jgi:hypothetical protein
VLFVSAVAAAWCGAMLRPRAFWETIRSRPEVSSFWLVAQLGFVFTVYEHQAHPDLLLIQPYYAVAVGVLLARLSALVLGRVRSSRVAATATFCATVLLFGSCIYQAHKGSVLYGRSDITLADQKLAAAALSLYREERGSVWVVGPVHLLALEGENNWVSYGFFWDDLERRVDIRNWRPLVEDRMPEVVVTGRGLDPGSPGWREAEYVERTPIFLRAQRIRVFLRRADADRVAIAPQRSNAAAESK